jgi:hypothetical protein
VPVLQSPFLVPGVPQEACITHVDEAALSEVERKLTVEIRTLLQPRAGDPDSGPLHSLDTAQWQNISAALAIVSWT